MAISLECACGTHFDVEDTFAGQEVTCPECHRPVKAATAGRGPLRTSGYAVASLVLTLVLAFTVVGTLAAVLLGVMALVSISRHPDRVTGAGYAIGGIVLGLVFTGLTVFAFSNAELFDQARESLLGNQVDRSGPLEVVRESEGFAITRPSDKWGVAKPEMLDRLHSQSTLMLANILTDAYIDVAVQERVVGNVVQCREKLLDEFRSAEKKDVFGNDQNEGMAASGFKLRESRRLPPLGDAAVEEVVVDIQKLGQAFTYLIHLIKVDRSERLYVVQGWAFTRRFPKVRDDILKGLNSFRLLKQSAAFHPVVPRIPRVMDKLDPGDN